MKATWAQKKLGPYLVQRNIVMLHCTNLFIQQKPRGTDMQTQWAIQAAKNQFSKVVASAVQGTPQVVTKRGIPVAVVVSAEQFDALSGKSRPGNGFAKWK